jgi:hypothetical protein
MLNPSGSFPNCLSIDPKPSIFSKKIIILNLQFIRLFSTVQMKSSYVENENIHIQEDSRSLFERIWYSSCHLQSPTKGPQS